MLLSLICCVLVNGLVSYVMSLLKMKEDDVYWVILVVNGSDEVD